MTLAHPAGSLSSCHQSPGGSQCESCPVAEPKDSWRGLGRGLSALPPGTVHQQGRRQRPEAGVLTLSIREDPRPQLSPEGRRRLSEGHPSSTVGCCWDSSFLGPSPHCSTNVPLPLPSLASPPPLPVWPSWLLGPPSSSPHPGLLRTAQLPIPCCPHKLQQRQGRAGSRPPPNQGSAATRRGAGHAHSPAQPHTRSAP